jgi:hypothetical protein
VALVVMSLVYNEALSDELNETRKR